ncbi:myelin-associated glycoprotein [Engraulis encrasicolus]|uniref:myelin-associated glycoprotein n=1 Tax=Engraulis encrasicolus TaxID=184585 RepID=UPI002FD5FBE8
MDMGLNDMIFLLPVTFVLFHIPGILGLLTLSVPERVTALEGSCLLIPCAFSQSQPPVRVELRLQYRWSTPMGALFPTAPRTALSQDASRVHKDFQGRVALSGDTATGDCSMAVAEVKAKDATSYAMEIRKLGETQWSRAGFRIDVARALDAPTLTDPGSVVDGQQVVLNCSVAFPCPARPPTLRWRWLRGRPDNSSVFGQPTVLLERGSSALLWASLSFTASYHLKPRIRCEVEYAAGAPPVLAFRDVHVKFPPKDVHIRLHTLAVREGGSALLECSCKADPPVDEYVWAYTHSQRGRTHTSPLHALTIRVDNVTRHTRVRCTARNRLGWTPSSFTALNVEYKPHILSKSSWCEWDGAAVRCRCMVDSSPRAAITWSVNGSLPPPGYNTSLWVHANGTVTARLAGETDVPPEVVCYANNAHGNDSHPLMQDKHGSVLWMTVAALCVAVCLLFILTAGLLFCYCCRQAGRRRTVINHHSQTVYPGDMAIYQEHTPLYINCTEVTHIYTNGSYQLVYQNCTPRFVRTKQTHKRQRRPGRRERATREAERPRQRERPRERPRPAATTAELETAIYLEVI